MAACLEPKNPCLKKARNVALLRDQLPISCSSVALIELVFGVAPVRDAATKVVLEVRIVQRMDHIRIRSLFVADSCPDVSSADPSDPIRLKLTGRRVCGA
jgi:hypothetical protein